LPNVARVLFLGSKQLVFRVVQEMHSHSPSSLVGIVTIDDRDDTRSVFTRFHDFAHDNSLQLHVASGGPKR
jgi:hypothetical protein